MNEMFTFDSVSKKKALFFMLLWTLYTNELNVFKLIIIYQLLYFP